MKKLITITMLVLSTICLAELPSWGMTENQYKLPNFSSKMNEIGAQATKNNWLLKITAPKDWHKTIRMGLTDAGSRDVQVNFKDSLYQSIAISAVKGIKVANVSSSGTAATVQKQVIIDKPDMDFNVEAPAFEKLDIKSNHDELLESITNMEIAVPNPTAESPQASEQAANQAVVVKPVEATPVKEVVVAATDVQSQNRPSATVNADEATIEESKESLRKKHARTKRVNKIINYSNINSKDELFIQDQVVLVKRFINQGVVLFFWMKESYDPTVHKLVEKGSGKYQKDPDAIAGDTPSSETEQEDAEETVVVPTTLDFIAVDTEIEDQDELRKNHARNKGVEVNIAASQLKEDDVLYVLNKTVLVERPITSSQSAYFWLVGDTTITREVERKDDNRFIIR
ncbi:hypothetical protein [Marinicella litoralis]|uniref:Peptidoglycan-binding protein CsiV n=1 Tax=Marinicella litoralis TaxID=644220 RepID=A0A4R6XJ99_9GAMM|nr:hypothetical protein [Marinicella litoralis]TDR17487.1 hypothetical protein C8D91_2546 [Marinicella litoralis]